VTHATDVTPYATRAAAEGACGTSPPPMLIVGAGFTLIIEIYYSAICSELEGSSHTPSPKYTEIQSDCDDN
jgi:hypothetical protein